MSADCSPPDDPDLIHLRQIDLARRWRMSPRSLERWRWLRIGPPWLKLGGRVVYRLVDVERFEADRQHRAAEKESDPAAVDAGPSGRQEPNA